jgi:hypothetical protein
MKMPKRPPRTEEVWNSVAAGNRMTKVVECLADPAFQDEYLHWDELQHRKPPVGLSVEEWWLVLKFGRARTLKPIPLKDKTGGSFLFSLPDVAQEGLYGIDQDAAGQLAMPEQVLNKEMRDRYIVRSLVQEAISSSQLEGAATTRLVAKEMIRTQRPPRDEGERMILNNYFTMQRIIELKDAPLTQ